jgi:hypothetical protein
MSRVGPVVVVVGLGLVIGLIARLGISRETAGAGEREVAAERDGSAESFEAGEVLLLPEARRDEEVLRASVPAGPATHGAPPRGEATLVVEIVEGGRAVPDVRLDWTRKGGLTGVPGSRGFTRADSEGRARLVVPPGAYVMTVLWDDWRSMKEFEVPRLAAGEVRQ